MVFIVFGVSICIIMGKVSILFHSLNSFCLDLSHIRDYNIRVAACLSSPGLSPPPPLFFTIYQEFVTEREKIGRAHV